MQIQINETMELKQYIRESVISANSERCDLVREVLHNILNVDREYARYVKDRATKNSEDFSSTGTSKSIRDEFNEATVKEMCGEVKDEIKQYFSVNCDCNTNNEVLKMKLMKKNHEHCIKLLNEISTIVEEIGKKLIKDPKDLVKSGNNNNTSSPGLVEYPKRIDVEPPIIILGPNGTEVPEANYLKIRWKTPQGAARMLCSLVFDRTTILMTNFSDIILDPYKVSDIEHCVKAKTMASTEEIHKAVAKKCHDTHIKFMKYRLSRGIEF